MNEILNEMAIVVGLILLNGFFSGSEMAIISIRKTRLKQLVKKGDKNAAIVDKLKKNPEEFLATIQTGITLISVIASAYAGATIAEAITPILRKTQWPFLAENAASLSFIIIVIVITYLSIVLGELIPKSLGIKYSEKFALLVAGPILFISKISFPVTKVLTASSNLALKIFGDKTSFSEAKLTEEELRFILHEGHKSGIIEKHEHEILGNVLEFSDIAVDQIMTPRSQIFAIDQNASFEEKIGMIAKAENSKIPFYDKRIDNITGILYAKEFLPKLIEAKGGNIDFSLLLRPPYFVPNTQKIGNLLKKFQKDKIHLAIVTDEHGDVDGIVTIEDILEEIVGDISDVKNKKTKLIRGQKDGTYMVEGSLSIIDFNRFFKTSLPENATYTTISGLLLDMLEKFPDIDAKITVDNVEFTVKDKTERLIKSIEVKKTGENQSP